MSNPFIGSTFESFLDEDGIRDVVESAAIKEVFSFTLSKAMREKNIGKTKLATLMGTSRTQVSRILDPSNRSINLETAAKAARSVGLSLRLELVELA